MKAKEMFEKLGLYGNYCEASLYYRTKDDKGPCQSVEFYYPDKTIVGNFQDNGYLTVDELKAIYKQAEELGWIRSEPEKRLETNYEHYKDEIVRFFINDIAKVNGRFALCNEVNCSECDFHDASSKGDCIAAIENWLKLKHTYRLTRFEYDLLRTNTESKDKTFNDFATYKKLRSVGYFRGIDFELKIDDVLANCEVIQ